MSQKTYMYDTQWTALINAINGGDTSAIATALGQIKTSVDSITTALGSLSTDVTQDATQWSDLLSAIANQTINVDLYGNQNEYIDITTDFNNGSFSANLKKYHAGNFIKKSYNNVSYVAVLADYNTFYNSVRTDFANINVPHWVAIVFGFPVGQINAANTTANGFMGSAMNDWLKGDCTTIVKAAFGESHLKSHQCLLSNGTYNSSSITHGFGWTWEAGHYTMLMTEAQLGYRAWSDLGWSVGEAHKPLKIFQNDSVMGILGRDYGQSNNNFNTSNAWLRDIGAYSPGTDFCYVSNMDGARISGASGAFGRFPIIILV